MISEFINLTLLYVEDDEDTRKNMLEVLQHKVKNVYVAKDGLEALETFKNNNIHFVISDYQMPKMNGNELCSEIKKISPDTHFVLLTAYNDSELLIKAIDSGVDKFLQKPIKAKKLFTIIDDINAVVLNKYKLEKSTVCLREAEKIALLSYWDINLTNNVMTFSKESKELFQLDTNENISYKDFTEKVIEEDRVKFLEIFENRLYTDEYIDEVVTIINNKGKHIYIHLIAKKWKSSICGKKHIIGLFQDVTHYELQKIKLLEESLSDPMLKIANKKLIIKELENSIKSSKRYGHSIGVIFFDIDNFKHINDKYGHLVADDILVELTSIIKTGIRQSDQFGRWGGDEFVLISGYSSPEATIELAQKILDKIKVNNWSNSINLTVSIGISFYEVGDSVKSLISRADTKMYEAKKLGKNRYCYK